MYACIDVLCVWYVLFNCCVLSATTTLVAGTGVAGTLDGSALNATFKGPTDATFFPIPTASVDYVIIADPLSHKLRKLDFINCTHTHIYTYIHTYRPYMHTYRPYIHTYIH